MRYVYTVKESDTGSHFIPLRRGTAKVSPYPGGIVLTLDVGRRVFECGSTGVLQVENCEQMKTRLDR